MSSQTPNINLTLPTGAEKVSRQIINDNNTIIDGKMGAVPGGQNLQGEIDALNGKLNKNDISSGLTSSYGTVVAYEATFGSLHVVAITFTCTTQIPKSQAFISGFQGSATNRAPVVPMFNTETGNVYHALMSSSGELTSHVELLPTGSYRMQFAYLV